MLMEPFPVSLCVSWLRILSAVIAWLCPEALRATCVLVNSPSLSTSAPSTGEIRTVIRLYGASWWTIWASNGKVRGTRCSEKNLRRIKTRNFLPIMTLEVSIPGPAYYYSLPDEKQNKKQPQAKKNAEQEKVGGGRWSKLSECTYFFFFSEDSGLNPMNKYICFTTPSGIFVRQNI